MSKTPWIDGIRFDDGGLVIRSPLHGEREGANPFVTLTPVVVEEGQDKGTLYILRTLRPDKDKMFYFYTESSLSDPDEIKETVSGQKFNVKVDGRKIYGIPKELLT